MDNNDSLLLAVSDLDDSKDDDDDVDGSGAGCNSCCGVSQPVTRSLLVLDESGLEIISHKEDNELDKVKTLAGRIKKLAQISNIKLQEQELDNLLVK